MKPPIGPTTRLCMSLAARPGTFGSRFHNHLYDALGLDYLYKAFSTRDLAGAVAGIRALDIRGCAVSMPFKEAVIPMLDGLRDSAAAIDSVNTIVNDDGVLLGYNTDYSAVRDLIEPLPRSRNGARGNGSI
ncbi:shikimate dehydrogenase, partial [Sphingomonas endophytica]